MSDLLLTQVHLSEADVAGRGTTHGRSSQNPATADAAIGEQACHTPEGVFSLPGLVVRKTATAGQAWIQTAGVVSSAAEGRSVLFPSPSS